MKKYFTLCLFTLAFVLGTQSNFAQESVNANELAIKKTENLKKIMDLTQDQQTEIISLYESIETMKIKLASQTRDGVIHLKRLKSIEEKEDAKLQGILNEKQFSIYTENKKKMSAH